MRLLPVLLVSVLLAAPGCAPPRRSVLGVTGLGCELDRDPLGVDVPQPRLSWVLQSPERDQIQSAYQVLVASTPAVLARHEGDLWNSGRVTSGETAGIRYHGRALNPAQEVFWKVRVWDRRGHPSDWSPAATWTMGLLGVPGAASPRAAAPPGWQAHWITDPGLFRWQRALLGYHSEDATDPHTTKWVQVDLGESRQIDAVRLDALRTGVVEGTGLPRGFKVEVSDDPDFAKATMIADYTAKEYPNPWIMRIELPAAGVAGRYVRLTATRLRVEEGRACLALSQVEVLADGKNVAVGAAVTASDSVERAPWAARALTDGLGVPGSNPRANTTLLLRRDFTVRPGLRRALVFVCGLGEYQLSVDGRRAGAAVLGPGWTDYAKTCLYDTLDVTGRLHAGGNAVGLALAGGMYNVQAGRYVKFVTPFRPLTAIAEIRLEYADGTTETVGTDDRWRVAPGPVTFANMYGGEDHDARLDQRGWDQPGFDDSGWHAAATWPGPGGTLRGHSYAAPPLRPYELLRPVAAHPLAPGVTVYDLGQNAAVLLRLQVRGPAGATVRIIPAELLDQAGGADQASCGGPTWWQYTLAGKGVESWAPDFFYIGCRYLQVECDPPAGGADRPAVEAIAGAVVHAAAPAVGEFACSNELFNRIHTLVRWAQQNNLVSVLTDCPHRERLGWLEQSHLNGPALRYEWGLPRLLAKVTHDLADAQRPDGLVPSIAPEYIMFPGAFRDSPEWGSACILIPWQQYEWTGDTALLRRSYGMMKRYVAYLGTRADHHLLTYGLGDWFDRGPKPPGVAQLTPVALTATAFYYDDASILAQVATLLGETADASQYAQLTGEIGAAFNRAFFHPATGSYATGSQCANAIPLVMGLAPADQRAAVLAAIVTDVRDHGNALTAGDVGYRYLLRALAAGGRSDVIYAMNDQSAQPGYGYQLAHGATSLTEAWDANPHASQDHFMLGQINEWFYHDLAGIQGDPAGPGFRRIIIRPAVLAGLRWVKASYDSIRGRIASEWTCDRTQLTLHVTIPPNTTATVYVPTAAAAAVRESGRPAAQAPGVRYLGAEAGAAVFAVGSGDYSFTAAAPAR